MALVYNPRGMQRVAAGRRTKRLPHSCVGDGRRPTTHYRAEPVRERPLDFLLVQVPGVFVDALERVYPKLEAWRWNLISWPSGSDSSYWQCLYSFGTLHYTWRSRQYLLTATTTIWPLVAILKLDHALLNFLLSNRKQFILAGHL